jgi:transposase-like protein
MGKKHRQYTKEFKIETVRIIVERGRPHSEVTRVLGTALKEIEPKLRMPSLQRTQKGYEVHEF